MVETDSDVGNGIIPLELATAHIVYFRLTRKMNYFFANHDLKIETGNDGYLTNPILPYAQTVACPPLNVISIRIPSPTLLISSQILI